MPSRPGAADPDGRLLVAVAGAALLGTELGLLLLQIAIPGWATAFAADAPEVADLVVPYSAAAIAFIACFQVALLVAWRILWLSVDGRGRSRAAVRCASIIVGCAGVATVLTVVVLVHVAWFTPGGPSLLWIGLTAIIGIVTTLFLVRWRRRLASEVSGAQTAR